jgi:Domain of unknown function (DUF3850)
MAIIKKKMWPEYYDAVASGRKKFDLRAADFDVAEGDTLILEEWNPKTAAYTGRTITRMVTFVGKFTADSFGQRMVIEERGFYVMSLE